MPANHENMVSGKTENCGKRKSKTLLGGIIVVLIIGLIFAGISIKNNKKDDDTKTLPDCFKPIELYDQAFVENSKDILKEAVSSAYFNDFNSFDDMHDCTFMEDEFIRADVVTQDEVISLKKKYGVNLEKDGNYKEYNIILTHCNQAISKENKGYFFEYVVGKKQSKWKIIGSRSTSVNLGEVDKKWSRKANAFLNAYKEGNIKKLYKNTIANNILSYKFASPFINEENEKMIMQLLDKLSDVDNDSLLYAVQMKDDELREYKKMVSDTMEKSITEFDLDGMVGDIISKSMSKVNEDITEGMYLFFDTNPNDKSESGIRLSMVKIDNDWAFGMVIDEL